MVRGLWPRAAVPPGRLLAVEGERLTQEDAETCAPRPHSSGCSSFRGIDHRRQPRRRGGDRDRQAAAPAMCLRTLWADRPALRSMSGASSAGATWIADRHAASSSASCGCCAARTAASCAPSRCRGPGRAPITPATSRTRSRGWPSSTSRGPASAPGRALVSRDPEPSVSSVACEAPYSHAVGVQRGSSERRDCGRLASMCELGGDYEITASSTSTRSSARDSSTRSAR